MQVPLCMKFRFPIHDQMMAQCIIKMQDVLSAAAQSEPKRGGGWVVEGAWSGCQPASVAASWMMPNPPVAWEGRRWNHGIIGWQGPKKTPREWPKGSLKPQTRDNSRRVNGCLSSAFRANKLGGPGENQKPSTGQKFLAAHLALLPASAFQRSGGVPTLVH